MIFEKAICIASGPSLCDDDIALAQGSGWTLITVNSSWKAIPDCDVIYAGDWAWWRENYHEIHSHAQRWTCNLNASLEFNLNLHVCTGPYNSGQRAIQFAITKGATTILLLGYDCTLKYGNHWHENHDNLRNPEKKSILIWKEQFKFLAKEASILNVDIINCSRNTELPFFRKKQLSSALQGN